MDSGAESIEPAILSDLSQFLFQFRLFLSSGF